MSEYVSVSIFELFELLCMLAATIVGQALARLVALLNQLLHSKYKQEILSFKCK